MLVFALLVILSVAFAAPGPSEVDQTLTDFLVSVPGLFDWFWEMAYDLMLLWALFLIVLAVAAPGRKRLAGDLLLALAISAGSAVVVGMMGGTDLSTSMGAILSSTGPPVYLAVRVALVTAVVIAASPHVGRPLRRFGHVLIWVGALSAVALGVAYPSGVAAGLGVGLAAAAVTHLMNGSPGGRLTVAQIAEAVGDLDIELTDIRYAPTTRRGVDLALATMADGRQVLIKTFGRDAWDGQLLASLWTALWHRDVPEHVGFGRLQQVEHEGFVTLLAERAGVSVTPVVGAGMTDHGDALLLLETEGRRLKELPADDIDEATLREAWKVLGDLHALEIAHRQLDGGRILVTTDGSIRLTDLGAAQTAADGPDIATDRAQLLVATAVAVGVDRATEVALDSVAPEQLIDTLPFLQPAVLSRTSRDAVEASQWDLKALREHIASRTESEIPPLVEIRRVTPRSVAKLLIVGLIAYWLISAIAGVDFAALIDELRQADSVWLWSALLLSPLVCVPQAFSTMGATLQPLGFGPVLMLQYGIQFIALAVPSSAARIALEIRFFQRVGMSAARAVALGTLDSLSGFAVQLGLITLILLSDAVSLKLPSGAADGSSEASAGSLNWENILIATGLVLLALVVGMLLPRTRAMIRRSIDQVREKREEAKEALRVLQHPKKLLFLFGGNLVAQVLLAVILGMCLQAFGYSAPLAALILVNTFVSLFAGFMPVPGGVGVAEAAYTASLIAIGIPQVEATSTALLFRVVTFYLPPLWGAPAMRWLRQHSYV